MNVRITTSQLPPIAERQAGKGGDVITSNKIQPNRPRDLGADRTRFDGKVITTRNLEEVQEENRKAEKGKKK